MNSTDSIDAMIGRLRADVEQAREALRKQHALAMAQQEASWPGAGDAFEVGTRVAGEALRLAMARLDGAEQMLEACAQTVESLPDWASGYGCGGSPWPEAAAAIRARGAQ